MGSVNMPPGKVRCIGVGISKTGTTSLGDALRLLGFRVEGYHPELLKQCANGSRAAALEHAEDYEGFEDFPWPLLYEEMAERFPEARFVLTLRKDVSTWHRSVVAHVQRKPRSLWAWELVYGSADPVVDRARYVDYYESHAERVRSFFQRRAPERLLTVCWEHGDGWDELCAYLGMERPAAPFPHSNAAPRNPSLIERVRRRLGI